MAVNSPVKQKETASPALSEGCGQGTSLTEGCQLVLRCIQLKTKLIKIGAKVVSHGRYVTFQMAEVAVPRQMFQEILTLIARLRAPPAPA